MSGSLVQRADLRVLNVLAGMSTHFGKLWCFPNQRTLLEQLRLKHGRTMCRRTLNNHLGALERDGYIKRHRRHKKGEDGQLELHSTVYTLLAKTIRLFGLHARFVRVAKAHPWADRWIFAVQKRAQSMDTQTDITAQPPKKQAALGDKFESWLRRLRQNQADL